MKGGRVLLMNFMIKGTGHAVPERILTNAQLEQMVDTSDEWIVTRTGIRNRHIMEANETAAALSARAAKNALADSGIKAEELDLIIGCTVHGDYFTPSLACCVQKELGAACPAFDLNAACSGFLYGLKAAEGFFATGTCKKILIFAYEGMSRMVNWNDRATCVLFGDGAGAAVLTEGNGFCASVLGAKGDEHVLYIKNDCSGKPFVTMNGQEVFRFAVSSGCRDIPLVLAQAGLEPAAVSHVVLHQANERIIKAIASKLNIPRDRYVMTIQEYGNTSASSIPIALDLLNREGKLLNGQYIVMAAFGGGLTSAACVIKWGAS